MILTREQLNKISTLHKFIFQKSEDLKKINADSNSEFIFSDERIEEFIAEEEDIDEFEYYFPAREDNITITTEELLNLSDEIINMDITNPSIIKTPRRRYYITGFDFSYEDYLIRENSNLSASYNGIKINLVEQSFLVGLAATFLGVYDDDDNERQIGTIDRYIAIELIYEDGTETLSTEEELKLVNAYKFEVADSTGMVLGCEEISFPDEQFIEDAQENAISNLRPMESYNDGMSLFIAALKIQEDELRFFNFYKVLEYFAPVALNIEANELMCKKLSSSSQFHHNGDYIRSIFTLAHAYINKYQKDEDLIVVTFSTCFDFIALFEKLPKVIKKKIKKNIGCEQLDYSIDKQKLTTACNIAGRMICKTRNMIVHSKLNYKPTGDECPQDDIPQLNVFMKEACSQAIRWYNRLPEHQKLTVIE